MTDLTLPFLDQTVAWIAIGSAFVLLLLLSKAFAGSAQARRRLRVALKDRDKLDAELSKALVQLDRLDPEKFLIALETADAQGQFRALEDIALTYTGQLSEAFGRAAQYLAHQRILDSAVQGLDAAQEAVSFAAIGLAACPGAEPLLHLQHLALARVDRLKQKGDPEAAHLGETALDVDPQALSSALMAAGDFALARLAATRAQTIARTKSGAQSLPYAAALSHHGTILCCQGDFETAEELQRQALEITANCTGRMHTDCAKRLCALAEPLVVTHRYKEAEQLYREAAEIDRKILGAGHPDYAIDLNNLAGLLVATGRYAEADPLYRVAWSIFETELGADHVQTKRALDNLNRLLMASA